jgi:hypothetical protein
MGIGSLAAVFILLMIDPGNGLKLALPFGATLAANIAWLLQSFFYIGFLHIARKGLFDYLDLEEYFLKAKTTPEGAGYALIGVGLMMVSIAIVIMAATKG